MPERDERLRAARQKRVPRRKRAQQLGRFNICASAASSSSLASFTTPRTCDCGESPPRHRSTSSSTTGAKAGTKPERDNEGGRGPLLSPPPADSPARLRIRTTHDTFAPASARSRISSFVRLEWTCQCVTLRLGASWLRSPRQLPRRCRARARRYTPRIPSRPRTDTRVERSRTTRLSVESRFRSRGDASSRRTLRARG